MSKASDHMVTPAPVFVQLGFNPNQSFLSKLAAVKRHQQGSQGAGDYAWGAIFTAIDDMVDSLKAQTAEADEKFQTCETELKSHHESEQKLLASKAKNEADKLAAETLISDMEENIRLSKEEISRSTKEIKDTNNDIREALAEAAKQTKEAQDASALFKQAVTFLKNYKSNSDLSAPESGSAAYQTKTMAGGTEKVVAIIETVEKDMMKEVDDMNKQTQTNVEGWNTAIADAKDRIKNAKATIGESTTKKADGEATVSGADVFLQAAEEGLAAEAEWWGPAPGNKLPSPGEDCIAYLGKEELAAQAGRAADFTATDKLAGDGKYHSDTKEYNDELAALSEFKGIVEDIKNQYLVAQPAGSVGSAE
jgi:hypothetical protein